MKPTKTWMGPEMLKSPIDALSDAADGCSLPYLRKAQVTAPHTTHRPYSRNSWIQTNCEAKALTRSTALRRNPNRTSASSLYRAILRTGSAPSRPPSLTMRKSGFTS